MTQTQMLIVVYSAVSILAIACYLTWKRLISAQQQIRSIDLQKQQHIKENLERLALSILSEQMNLSEGCIRLKLILDHHVCSEATKQRYESIYRMYDLIKDFDTHEARANLIPKERMAQDAKRYRLEIQHEQDLKLAAKRLLEDLKTY